MRSGSRATGGFVPKRETFDLRSRHNMAKNSTIKIRYFMEAKHSRSAPQQGFPTSGHEPDQTVGHKKRELALSQIP